MVDLEVLLKGKGNYCLNQENFKNGYGLYCYGEISEGSGPNLPPPPPLDPPFMSLIDVAIPLCDIDGDYLMNSTN